MFWCAVKLQTPTTQLLSLSLSLSLLRMTTDNCTLPINRIVTMLLHHHFNNVMNLYDDISIFTGSTVYCL